jgi:hypothetical protein
MVISSDGVGRTQRRDPKLAVIEPRIHEAGTGREQLTLCAPGMEALHLDVELTGRRRAVDMLGTALRGIDQGEDAADWLSEILGAPSRLVRVPPENDRRTDGLTPGTSRYADSSAVHILSRATLDHLHTRIEARHAERGAGPAGGADGRLPMARFRPNIVVDGWDGDPHAEDHARRLRIGEVELGFAKLAVRCAVTMVEQRSGTKSGPEPLRTLATYRRAPGGGVTFGAKFSVLRPGTVSVGDEARVETRADAHGM